MPVEAIRIKRIGIAGIGLDTWKSSIPILRGDLPYQPEPMPALSSHLLPANEWRRASKTIRLALRAAQDAIGDVDGSSVATVFASSDGDSDIVDKICASLVMPQRPVSPTLFHNSVHNAPAGCWAIATGSMAPSSSLSAREGSFAACLLDGISQALAEAREVLVVAYDEPPPPALARGSNATQAFACALLLSPETGSSAIRVSLAEKSQESTMPQPALERLRLSAPAARSLPLLASLAQDRSTELCLPYLDDCMLAVCLEC